MSFDILTIFFLQGEDEKAAELREKRLADYAAKKSKSKWLFLYIVINIGHIYKSILEGNTRYEIIV